ncbi:hypothetical protein BKA15_005151 [Microlunatus parietis]|uniref:Uncharacterized protein n=1 Tax=Microlunatus parietis TaxID=682979 RepID=A0A7Y9IBV5_9ACTN|nr:hypothetical protein [Microlunatus parietis]
MPSPALGAGSRFTPDGAAAVVDLCAAHDQRPGSAVHQPKPS